MATFAEALQDMVAYGAEYVYEGSYSLMWDRTEQRLLYKVGCSWFPYQGTVEDLVRKGPYTKAVPKLTLEEAKQKIAAVRDNFSSATLRHVVDEILSILERVK